MRLTSMASCVLRGAAASAMATWGGRMYGYCAAAQPHTTAVTASPAARRAGVNRRRSSSTRKGSPSRSASAHRKTAARYAQVPKEQLARTLGLSRVTVNRALARLSGAGAIRLTARGIVVADRQRLDAFSNDS